MERLVLGRLADKRIVAALRHVPDTEPIQREIATLRKRRDDITDLLADGILDRRKAHTQATALTEKIDALSGRLAAMRRESPLTDLGLARSIPTRWKKLGVLDRRRVIEELGLRVTIEKGRPVAARWVPTGSPCSTLAVFRSNGSTSIKSPPSVA